MGRTTRFLLLFALVLQGLPLAALLSIDSRAAGLAAEPRGGALSSPGKPRVVSRLAMPSEVERRMVIEGPPPDTSEPRSAGSANPHDKGRTSASSAVSNASSLQCTLSGKVIDADGRPARFAHLVLNQAGARDQEPVHSNAEGDGSFAIDVQPGRTYHLMALPGARCPVGEEMETHAAYALDLVAPAGDLVLRMRNTDAVAGMVRDAGGVPQSARYLRAFDDHIGLVAWSHTDENGLFQVRVRPGSRLSISVLDEDIQGGWWTRSNIRSNGPLQVIDLPHRP